ncbi:gametocyte-specific factor 1-like [Anneissia japonica]|uniref:gametocyte-specific factor 1-like n=1 Tax=Anneissia japonica TaxID=1529436 RepID=UPI0014255152|nr:gametocyte-specific factor 1-like [Anneissia japonica]
MSNNRFLNEDDSYCKVLDMAFDEEIKDFVFEVPGGYQCPYDKSHVIRDNRFPYHLAKCKRNYGGVRLHTCPYNARHRMGIKTLMKHVHVCVDKPMEQMPPTMKGCTTVPPYDDATWEAEYLHKPSETKRRNARVPVSKSDSPCKSTVDWWTL